MRYEQSTAYFNSREAALRRKSYRLKKDNLPRSAAIKKMLEQEVKIAELVGHRLNDKDRELITELVKETYAGPRRSGRPPTDDPRTQYTLTQPDEQIAAMDVERMKNDPPLSRGQFVEWMYDRLVKLGEVKPWRKS
jgi:hypothetical protein